MVTKSCLIAKHFPFGLLFLAKRGSSESLHCISTPRSSSGFLFVAILDLRKKPGRKHFGPNNPRCDCNRLYNFQNFGEMGQGSSKERYKSAVKKLSSIELANIEAVFNEVSTKREDGTRHVELSLINRQDFAERFRLPGFIAERLFLAFDRNEVSHSLRNFFGEKFVFMSYHWLRPSLTLPIVPDRSLSPFRGDKLLSFWCRPMKSILNFTTLFQLQVNINM